MLDPHTVQTLQERTARALPAEHVELADGWWLRHTTSGSWWAGTVLPHRDATQDELVRRVEAAEAFYSAREAPARFQISPGACPPGLDPLLESRGYRRESPMSLRTAATERVRRSPGTGGSPTEVDQHPGRAWFDTWYAVHGNGGTTRSEWDLLDRVDRPSGFARVTVGGEIVAVGRAVADAGWAGVFGMATLPAARGTGAAHAVLTALADWAAAHGAGHMYLQVEPGNAAALCLYDNAGFTEAVGYHYRVSTRGERPG